MADTTQGFTVTDRRKFTIEGELRDEAAASAQAAPEETPRSATPAPQAREEGPSDEASTGKHVVDPKLEPLPDEQPDLAGGEEEYEGEMPELTAAETAEQHAAYRRSSQQLDDMVAQANPGMKRPAPSEMDFDKLVQSIYMTAALQLGAGTQPGEQPRVDILGARQSIDMLNVLTEKTKGNLADKEQKLLQNALFELRMMFLEITNAISTSAHQASRPGGLR